MTVCVLCSTVSGDVPSRRVYEDASTVAFLDIEATRGHTLVVPRVHVRDLWALSEDQAADTMRAVHRVARLLGERLDPLGLNVVQANGEAAWQEVPHYHVHLVPRYGDDGLVAPWRSTHPSDEVLAAVHHQIVSVNPNVE